MDVPPEELPERVQRSLLRECGVEDGEPLVVGVSGGLDSVALLMLLRGSETKPGPRQLVIVHVNHELRGEESEADEAFVRSLARELRLPIHVARVGGEIRNDPLGGSLEMRARRARHSALARAARDHGIRGIALAHHADDQVELFLLRLLRGTGSKGLSGMAPQAPSPADDRVRVVRPLLGTRRESLRRFCCARGIHWREDSTNRDLAIPRNEVRNRLLPALQDSIGTDVVPRLLRAAAILTCESDFVAQAADDWQRAPEAVGFEGIHPAVQREILRREMLLAGVEPSFDRIEQLRIERGGHGVPVGRGQVLRRSGVPVLEWVTVPEEVLSMEPVPVPVEFGRPSGYFRLPDGAVLEWRHLAAAPPGFAGLEGELFLDAASLGGGLVFRRWKPGDRMTPIGLGGSRKLQDLFTDRKVPGAVRRTAWVGTVADGGIFWVEHLPPSHAYRVTEGCTQVLGLRCLRASLVASR